MAYYNHEHWNPMEGLPPTIVGGARIRFITKNWTGQRNIKRSINVTRRKTKRPRRYRRRTSRKRGTRTRIDEEEEKEKWKTGARGGHTDILLQEVGYMNFSGSWFLIKLSNWVKKVRDTNKFLLSYLCLPFYRVITSMSSCFFLEGWCKSLILILIFVNVVFKDSIKF